MSTFDKAKFPFRNLNVGYTLKLNYLVTMKIFKRFYSCASKNAILKFDKIVKIMDFLAMRIKIGPWKF